MKWILIQLLIPLPLAFAALLFLEHATWLSVTGHMMVCLTVVAAAVLFRLGRGLPEFHTRELATSELKRLTKAYTDVAKRLSVILALILLAIAIMMSAHFTCGAPLWVNPVLVFLGVYFVCLVLCRTVALVKGDLNLIRLQGRLLLEDVQLGRARQRAASLNESAEASPLKPSKGYGGLASHEPM